MDLLDVAAHPVSSELPAAVQATLGLARQRRAMDASTRHWLYDPVTTSRHILEHRPPATSVVSVVVSDLVWGDVVRLLRWADAGIRSEGKLAAGTWWRLAGSCAELLRRLPRALRRGRRDVERRRDGRRRWRARTGPGVAHR